MPSETEPELWPIRPRPRRGEVFTGWTARLAQGLGVEPRAFLAWLRSRFRLESDRDLDMNPSYELLAEVSRRTAIRYDRLVVMTLRWHVYPFYARDTRTGRSSGFGFCPLCWSADPVPYIRRAWRLPWMPCGEHRIPLLWQCPACKDRPGMERLPAAPPLSRCTGCGFDLRLASPAGWPRTLTGQQIADLLNNRQREFDAAEPQYVIVRTTA
jgi:hypothetical protein